MRLLLYIFLCLISLRATAQSPMPRVVNIDESKGLYLTDDVANVFVDAEGVVWITSFSEIVRYDGTSFQKLETAHLKHGSFLRVEETPCNEKYVIDLDGRIFFIEREELTPYKSNNLIVERNIFNGSIDVRFDCDRNLIVSIYSRGIWKVEEEVISQVKLGKEEYNRWVLQSNDLPLSSQTDYINPLNIQKILQSKVELYSSDFKLIDSTSFMKDKKNRNLSFPVIKLPNDNFLGKLSGNTFIEFNDQRILNMIPIPDHLEIVRLFLDSKNNLWMSTWGGKIYCFENSILDFEKVKIFSPKGVDDVVVISAEDKSGDIWGYSEKNGVFKFENLYECYYNKGSGYNDLKNVDVFAKNDSILFYGKGNRIGHLNLISTKTKIFAQQKIPKGINYKPSVLNNRINSIAYNNHTEQLLFCQSITIQFIKDGKIDFFLNDKLDRLFGNNNYLKTAKERSTFSLSGVHHNQYYQITGDTVSYISPPVNDEIVNFVEVGDSVLLKTPNETFLLYRDNLYSLKEQYPLLNRKIKDWVAWNNKVWISIPEHGLFTLGKDSLEKVFVHGVSPTDIRISIQNDSSLWLFSAMGSFEVTKQEKEEIITAYNPLSKVNLTEIEIDGEELYAGTQKSGLLKVDLTALREYPLEAPILNLTKVVLGAEEQALGDTIYEVDHTLNDLKVFFKGRNFSSWVTNYRYRLKGRQDDWTYTRENKAEYFNLNPGEYNFEVQVRKGEQVWSSSQSIQLVIVPPLWERGWFIILCLFLVSLIAFFIIQNRLKRLNREKLLMISRLTAEQRALRAKMDPHFMFNVIASLQYLVNNNLNKKASVFLDQFSSLMRSTLDQTNLELVAIQNEILFLKEYIQMERLRLEERFDFDITVEKGVDETVEIPNFLIQPFVENAIHHGLKLKQGKGHLNITYSQSEGFLQVRVEDDGLGYNETRRIKSTFDLGRKSHGIATVKKRLELMNGRESVTIEDLSDIDATQTGTRVTLLIKI